MRLSSLRFSPSINISFYFCVADILDACIHRGKVPMLFYSESSTLYLLAVRSTAEVQGAPAAWDDLFHIATKVVR